MEDNFWAGRTGQSTGADIRRGIIAFDLSSIPTGSVVTSATLTLYLDKDSTTTPRNETIHKCLANWGEGTSVSTGGSGGPSTASTNRSHP